jgi:hypothetical protein
MNRMKVALAAAAALALTACNSSDPEPGTFSLQVTDAPVDHALAVVVEFTGVELRRQGGSPIQLDFEPRQIDLLQLTGESAQALLDEVEVPSGRYEQIRLKVNAGREGSDSYIELADGRHPLFIPSGNQSGLKLVRGFTVPAGGAADFTVDFDLRKSVTNPQGQDGYILRPTLRLIDNSLIGAIAGSVAPELLAAEGCTPAVYLYEGADATPVDVNLDREPNPISSALVDADTQSYHLAYLSPGEYTVAFTCDAALDDPEADDDLLFAPVANATVAANETTVVDLQ